MGKTKRIFLMVPCYNEEDRLDMNAFLQFAVENRYVIFCNDGSTDKSAEVIRSAMSKNSNLLLIESDKNLGKANVLQYAFQRSKEHIIYNDADWVGFWDGDLSTPLFEVENFFKYAALYKTDIQGIFGSRVYRLGANIKRKQYRHYIARILATLFHYFLGIETYDSQCGSKLLSFRAAELAFSNKFRTRWLFDLEILLRLKQSKIIEYPLQEWCSKDGSKITLKENIRIFFELLLLVCDKTNIKSNSDN